MILEVKQKPRNLNIDLVKIVAMLGVVMLHSTHDYMTPDGLDLASFMYKTAVISIPLFFMVSGYLQLGRSTLSYRYIGTKVMKILRYVLIFCIAYWILYSIVNQQFSVDVLLRIFYESAVGRGPFFVFWYFTAIIMIYLLLIPINSLYNKYFNLYFSLLILLVTIQDIVFIHNLILGQSEVNTILRQYNWLTYFLIGGMLKKYQMKDIHLALPLILCIINYIFQVIMVSQAATTYCSFFYSSLPIVVFVTISFIFINNLKISLNNPFIKHLSNLFLLVFTIHSFFISPLTMILPTNGWIAPFLCWLLTSIFSIGISWLIMRIPYASKVFKI